MKIARTDLLFVVALLTPCSSIVAAEPASKQPGPPRATIDGAAPGFRDLSEADFTNVNCAADTWTWKDGTLHCTGQPVGVLRSKEPITNFELVAEWRHLKPAGNSGIFVWTIKESLDALKGPGLPHGIEVQVLDLAYTAEYEKSGKKADWFTAHGDVFPVGKSTMKPFPPVAPDGRRSFPTKHLSKGVGQWNHYYVRAINGEVRLWVNGEEVSGGTNCEPRTGYLCLESEAALSENRCCIKQPELRGFRSVG
ncbi:MAG: DUF1080 domain-containing protein [Pirellulales bacterium]|nr:DUF1080 domain-containing protein [Pirellulales bacterium]